MAQESQAPGTFRDANGVSWTVIEVPRNVGPTRAHDTIPPATKSRLLIFISSTGERRRLADYPTAWKKLPPSELAALCRRATDDKM